MTLPTRKASCPGTDNARACAAPDGRDPVAGRHRDRAVDRQAKVPLLISIAAGGSAIPRLSPYVARVTFTLWQQGYPIGKWAAEQGWKKAYTAVSDFIPGHDSEAAFTKGFGDGGGQIIGAVRIPPNNPDFAPFVQRIKDARPDVVFFWVPSTQATALAKAVRDIGLREAGIQITSAQDLLPDEQLPAMGDAPLGLITSGNYSTAGVRPANASFLAAWKREYADRAIPNFLSVNAWDGMVERQKESLPPKRRWHSSRIGRTLRARAGRL